MKNLLSLVNGPQTFGQGRTFWSAALLLLVAALFFPLFVSNYTVGNVAFFAVWVFMALGLSLIWGYGGMLSFGQTAFFGMAGYSYGVIAINFGQQSNLTFLSLILALVMAGLLALLIGYFMIYGRITGVFVGIVTLSLTLTLATFVNQTAGPEWRIGRARLNGYNGMTRIPPLSIPWVDGKLYFEGTAFYFLVLALLVVTYLGLRILVNSRFGNVLVAIRENPDRAELLGYDIRRYQLAAFVIGSTLAGLSGALYTAWGQFIAPASMALPAAAMPIIWVAVGGRKDLTATMVGTLLVLWLFQSLIVISQQYALIFIGALLLVTILFTPGGYLVWLMEHWQAYTERRRERAVPLPSGRPVAEGAAE
ncbi:MAG TPA: branched-chain amino acid ABC transporter permease [Geminicoccus sp.]|jgi:branched-chain amino acid transport system permease protein|uniref:branched-chain amino acid ABC transporter permease n=1 Tax=Geminicoccus sp. TaxID=2024832 RepID=UPI002E338FF7|nr:branched-chain amino acid ABC transporter permease [Geminicoccus sp.]HEX2527935.1 branched-chain amino acid ABC transporter permease [Geminicoccus sp.]